MKKAAFVMHTLLLSTGLALLPAMAQAQSAVATAPRGAVITEETVSGWSVKRSLLGKSVFNEKEEVIGVINDLLIAPDSTISHIIVQTGSEQGARDVAIDSGSIQVHDGKFYVEGVDKSDLEAAPRPARDLASFI